jgi:(5-formylfuran-3-yl)methyl phosphate synthase
MTRLLASVIDEQELAVAIAAGVDIIDLKNPQAGALGALPLTLIRHLVTVCGGRCPVSATVGDLPPEPMQLRAAIAQTASTGVDFIKVGFFGNDHLGDCLRAIAELTGDHAVIAVLFADRQPPLHRLSDFAAAGFRGVMIDTAGKGGGRLLDHIGLSTLEGFVEESRGLGMLSGLAGSLREGDIPRLLPLAPDYLGFRGALCEQNQRTASISPSRLYQVREALSVVPAQSELAVAGS